MAKKQSKSKASAGSADAPMTRAGGEPPEPEPPPGTNSIPSATESMLTSLMDEQLTSERSTTPSDGSEPLFLPPSSVKELTAQVNEVATMVLNGQIAPAKAYSYAQLVKVIAMNLGAAVKLAKLAKDHPELLAIEPAKRAKESEP